MTDTDHQTDTQKLWQQAKNVFVDYVDLPAVQALDAIKSRTELDPLLREKVIRLVQAMGKSKTLLDGVNSGQIFQQIKQLSDMTGQQLDNYLLTELLAVGGMSSIYKAQRVDSSVQKPVAIKVLCIQSEATDVVWLFNRELQALSKLNHQNIVAFYHGGESSKGVYYLVMELIEQAITIEQYIKLHQCDTQAIVTWVQQIALAMVNAHDHLIIHGDLKPDNILIDINHQLKVVDFGIAAFTYQNQKQSTPIYTPNIASPEQVKGESITIKSDIYSLGATLLQLVSGVPPQPEYEAQNYQANEIKSHIEQLLVTSDLDQDLCHIIRQAMQQDPAKRYVTMNEFAEDLACWLTDRPVSAALGGRLYHLKKFAARNKLLTTGGLLFLALLLVALGVVQNYALNASNEANKAQTTLEFMMRVLSQADPAHIDQGNTTIKEAFEITLDQSTQYLDNHPDLQINILTEVIEIYIQLALYDEAAATAEKVHQAYVLTEGKNSRNALNWLYEAAGHYHAAGAFEKCLTVGHQVIEHLDVAQLDFPAVRLNALNAIIKCHVERFENDQAFTYMKVAQQLMESGRIQDSEALGRMYNSFAVIARRQHAFGLSEQFYQKSLFYIDQSLGKDNTAYATILNGFGRMYMLQEKYAEAEPYLQESMQRVKSFDPDSHVLARNMSYYAKYLFDTGNQQQALEILDQATEIASKRKHQFTLMTIQDLRHQFNRTVGHILVAIEATEISLKSAHQLYGRDHPRVSLYLHQMATLLSVIEQQKRAELYWQNNLEFYLQAENLYAKELANTHAYMGINAWHSYDQQAAISHWQQAQTYQSSEKVTDILAVILGQKVSNQLSPNATDGSATQVLSLLISNQQGALRVTECDQAEQDVSALNMTLRELLLLTCSTETPRVNQAWLQFNDYVTEAESGFGPHRAQRIDQLLESIH